MSGRSRRRSSRVSAKKATLWPRTGPSGCSEASTPSVGSSGCVAEAAQGVQRAALVEEGEGRRVDAQLVAHGGEDGVGHLRRVGGGRQRARHGLHALCRLGGDAPAPFVPGLGAGRPQLHVALTAQVGDPHRHRGRRQHRHDAEGVVQLAVTVGGRADDEGEEGGQEADQRHPRGAGEGGGDEGGDGQEPDERDVPAVDGEDDRHRRGPDEGDQGGHGLGPVDAGAPGCGRKLLVSWFGHVLSPGRRALRATLFPWPGGQGQLPPFTGVVRQLRTRSGPGGNPGGVQRGLGSAPRRQ